MSRKIGFNSYIGFGRESSFGTLAQPADYIEYTSESLQKEEEEILIDSINGTNQFTKRVRGNVTVGGTIDYQVTPGSILKFIENMSGDAGTVSTLTAGEYQHTFVFKEKGTKTSLSFQVGADESDTLSVYDFTGCKLSALNYNVTAGGLLEGSAEIVGQNMAAANTISTASFQTLAPYVFKQGVIKVGNSTTVATTTTIDSFSLNIADEIISSPELGTNTTRALTPGMQNITMELGGDWNDNDIVDRFLNNTRSYVEATFDTGITISTTNTHKVEFKAFNCYFNGQKPSTTGPNEMTKGTFPIRSIYDVASTGSLMVIVTTNQATV